MEGDNMFHPLPSNNKFFHSDLSPKQGNSTLNYRSLTSEEPYHSTPKSKTKSSPSTGPPRMMSSSFSTPSIYPGAHESPSNASSIRHNRTSPGAKGVHSSPVIGSSKVLNTPPKYQSASPLHSYSSTNKSYMSELEASTIQKQRRELQLLIGELQDRDRELNEMVASHQKQLLAWEHDRQKLLTLEQRYKRLQGELGSRTDQMRTLTTRIKVLESQDQSKTCALESTQKQLQEMSERASSSSMQIRELQEQNSHMNSVSRDLSNKIGNLEAREQELLTMLKLKDKDLAEASSHLADVASKIKRLDQSNKELKQSESKVRKELSDYKQKCSQSKAEEDKLREELSERHNTTTEQNIELSRLKDQVMALNRELEIAGERENRKEQLIELQKSKQERTDSELSNLRQVYERQQRDLALLQLNFDSSQDKLRRSGTNLNNSSISKDDHVLCDTPSPCKSDPSSSPLSDHPNGQMELNDHHYGGQVGQQGISGTGDSDGSGDTEDLILMSHQGEASPTSKLHRLLTESQQMVQSLEQTALPPYVHTSQQKQNGSSHEHNGNPENR